jgi:hypothetical protein
MTVEGLSERDVSVPAPAFAPLSKQMGAYDMKIRYAVYRCSCVIHNFSSSQGNYASCSIRPNADA